VKIGKRGGKRTFWGSEGVLKQFGRGFGNFEFRK